MTYEAQLGGITQRWEGELVRMDASIDRATRTLYAMAEVEDPYGANRSATGMPLAVGLYVTATIHGRQLDEAVRIPREALRAGDTIYVLNENDQLDIRTVTVTHSSPDFAVIGEGLKPGDRLITSTIRNPIPGMALQAGGSGEGSLVSAGAATNGPG